MGTAGGLIAGGGIAGTRAALPMPLGSLTEPLRPRAFPGPGAMPLTPASWPGDLEGAARQSSAAHNNDTLPIAHRQAIIETSCTVLVNRRSPGEILQSIYSSSSGANSALKARMHFRSPLISGRTGRTGLRPGRALVPYACAGAPAVDDTCTPGRIVTTGTAFVPSAGRDNAVQDGEKDRDQTQGHWLAHWLCLSIAPTVAQPACGCCRLS